MQSSERCVLVAVGGDVVPAEQADCLVHGGGFVQEEPDDGQLADGRLAVVGRLPAVDLQDRRRQPLLVDSVHGGQGRDVRARLKLVRGGRRVRLAGLDRGDAHAPIPIRRGGGDHHAGNGRIPVHVADHEVMACVRVRDRQRGACLGRGQGYGLAVVEVGP